MCVWGRRIKNASRGAVKCNCREENISLSSSGIFCSIFFIFIFFGFKFFMLFNHMMDSITILLSLLAGASSATTAVELKDINLIITTDTHGWVASHSHSDNDPLLTANYGDVASFVSHVKDQAINSGRGDVFFVNNGDHVEGSGLSDATLYTSAKIHGAELFPIISQMPFDVLTIGNHDLYDDETVGFMVESGFIGNWDGHYLTSNTFSSNDHSRIGSPYIILEGEVKHQKVMFFGFLYHMKDSCGTITVTDPADEVKEDWFISALAEGKAQNVSAIVVMSHMDLVDDAVSVILKAIRALDPSIAVQFVTGHTHYRGFKKLDSRASTFEAGHYLDTVGLLTLDVPSTTAPEEEEIWFNYRYIDANKKTLMSSVGMGDDEASFDTSLGLAIAQSTDAAKTKLGLDEVLACVPKIYKYGVDVEDENSLYKLYMNEILPRGVNGEAETETETETETDYVHITSTGTLRYDLYEDFRYDDVFAIAPFANTFCFIDNVAGEEIDSLLKLLNVNVGVGEEAELPKFITSNYTSDGGSLKMFLNNYDQGVLVVNLAELRGVAVEEIVVVNWRADKGSDTFTDTTLVWKSGVSALFPC